MSMPLFDKTSLEEAIAALRSDLIHDDGPRISTMRNYRFAILQYDPVEEFKLRAEIQRLSKELMASGWVVMSLNLQKLFFDRVRAQGEDWVKRVIEMERRLRENGEERGLKYLKDRIAPLIEGPGGIAADCAKVIADFADQNPDKIDRTVVVIGRAGALYPYFRSSALLKHLAGKTRHIPVVLLYPGERRGLTGLSFMGILNADSDYRPRIYS